MEYPNGHQALVEACRCGDRKAQYELYRLYSKAMYNTILRIVRNVQDADDLLQNTFIEVFGKLETFRGDSTIGSWIKRIAINKSINFLKSRRMEWSELSAGHDVAVEEGENGRSDEWGAEEWAPKNLQVERIKQKVNELPSGYRVVFTLYAMEGYDHEEIAQIMGITEATSKSQYCRARVRLRSMLEEDEQYKKAVNN